MNEFVYWIQKYANWFNMTIKVYFEKRDFLITFTNDIESAKAPKILLLTPLYPFFFKFNLSCKLKRLKKINCKFYYVLNKCCVIVFPNISMYFVFPFSYMTLKHLSHFIPFFWFNHEWLTHLKLDLSLLFKFEISRQAYIQCLQ